MRDDCLAIDRATRKRARWRNGLDELQRDATFAARAVRRDLSFAILTIVILALGIGATTALFSLYNGVVMRPLAVANPERVMWMTMYDGEGSDGVSPAAYFAWRDRSRTIARLTTVREATGTLVGSGEPVRLEGLRVGESFFETLGIRPTAERALTARDNAPGADPVVVLGNAISSARFGGDSATVGRAISIDGVNRTVVGVLPPSIDVFGGKVEFVVPDALGEGLRTNWTPFLQAIALLNSGTSAAAAERELSAIATSKWKETRAEPLPPAAGVRVQSLGDHLTAPFRDRIALLFAGVICVLVIGCVNVANLLLARGAVRGREMSLRASLGASRGRLIRQLVTENGMLALIGGMAGVALATWMVRAIVLILPRDLPRLSEVRLDGTSTLFALSLTLITLLISGVVPALRAAEGDLRGALQGGGRGATAGSATDTLRSVFVVAQIAMTTVLLVVAGLLVRSAGALGAVSPGFSPDSVLTARYALSEREYNSAERVLGAHERILTSLQQSFGDHVALASSIPLGGGSGGSDFLLLGGGNSTRKEVNAGLRFVTPGYLRTMGITLLAGRDFDGRDTRIAERAIIISASLARALGLAVSPSTIGRSLGGTSSPFKDSTGTPFLWTVVGIVREPRDGGLRTPGDHQAFLPLAQTPAEVFDWSAREVHVVVRGGTAPERATGDVAQAVHRVDAKLALYDVQTMRSRLRASLALDEANTALLSALGVAALLLAITGLYGVISYGVAQRRPEVGVRLALGAQPNDIVMMITRWGGRLTVAGLAIGLPLALAFSRGLRALLFGIGTFDPITVIGTIIVLLAVAAVSSFVPARRASRTLPQAVLRA